ncbi:MAG: hypothetical protein ACI936_001172 [Paraglaciecola sp.]|jgi:hypothetical protein
MGPGNERRRTCQPYSLYILRLMGDVNIMNVIRVFLFYRPHFTRGHIKIKVSSD